MTALQVYIMTVCHY